MNISDQNNTPHGAKLASLVITLVLLALGAAHDARADTTDTTAVRKVLFLGDSMTGWMAERLNAYGEINGFEVATIVWDGSTISKWADTDGLADIIAAENPDAIMVCLGMNEMFEPFPEKRLSTPVEKLVDAFGDTPFLWIGPPLWPGKDRGKIFNDWMASRLGEGNYFSSLELALPRQSKTNPHPSRQGIEEWIDKVVEWIPGNSNLKFTSLDRPADGKVSRGKTFVYKRMKDTL